MENPTTDPGLPGLHTGPRVVFTLPEPCGTMRTMLRILLPFQVDPDQIYPRIEYPEPNIVEPPPTKIPKKPKPAIVKADEFALRRVIRHQKFRQPDWSSIRYSEVMHQFQAHPGFCALKPNALLSDITIDLKCNAILSRFDLTLGAIINGLMKDMLIFHDTVTSMPEQLKMKVGGAFLNPESKYRKNWDALFQYLCGRRQQVIQLRRELYKPPNELLKKALHDIPPSETHLFEDQAFKYFVEQVGGIDKLFPKEERECDKLFKDKANQTQWFGNRCRTPQNRRHGNRGKFVIYKKAYTSRHETN